MGDTAYKVEDLIPDGDGDYMRHKTGEKRGQYITLHEFTALSQTQQSHLTLSYDKELKRIIGLKSKEYQSKIRNDPVKIAERIAKARAAKERIRNDPVRNAAQSEKLKAANERIRNDPEKMAAIRAKQIATRERNRLAKLEANKTTA